MGIGNEEVGEAFYERYQIVAQAVKERYPMIKLIGTSGPYAAGSEYERGWRHAKERLTDLVDEHYYQSPEWFVANHHRYDSFQMEDPGVFLGEYASKGNTWYNALCEASYMIGLERNVRVVKMACYAPLFCSINHVNWRPDMIWYDGKRSYGMPNYYVQKLFMENQGEYTLPLKKEGEPKVECRTKYPDRIIGRIGLGCYESVVDYRNIVLKNEDTKEVFQFEGCHIGDGKEKKFLLPQTMNCQNYALELKAVELEGVKGFQIHFGENEETGSFCWTIGGWQNQDTVITEVLGERASNLSQCLMTVERGREYALRLVVTGRRIKTYIDDVLYHDIESKPIIVEPLYITAAEDCNQDILIKAVNLSLQKQHTELIIKGFSDNKHALTASVMSGWEHQAENSFDQPKKVSPVIQETVMYGSFLNWEFPAESVTILRISR